MCHDFYCYWLSQGVKNGGGWTVFQLLEIYWQTLTQYKAKKVCSTNSRGKNKIFSSKMFEYNVFSTFQVYEKFKIAYMQSCLDINAVY